MAYNFTKDTCDRCGINKKDAPVLAAAPVMLEALKLAESCLDVAQSVIDDDKTMDNTLTAMIKARAAIEAAEKGE